MIPKLIHFIWIGDEMQPWLVENLRRWQRLNPFWQFRIHRTEDVDPVYKELYRTLSRRRVTDTGPDAVDLCSLSDVLRLSVLRQEGGWYFDCDFVPILPMSDLYRKYDLSSDCFLTKQWEEGPKRIANGVIGIADGASAWAHIDRIAQEHSAGKIERTSFGPLLTSRLVQEYPGVTIGETDDFYKIRFNPREQAILQYQKLLKMNFHEDTLTEVFGSRLPIAMHLWMGRQDYNVKALNDLTPHSPLTAEELEQVQTLPAPAIEVSVKSTSTLKKGKKKVAVVCVLKTGGDYTTGYVSKLMSSVERNLTVPHDFICLTDSSSEMPCMTKALNCDWPGWWSKVELFRPGMFDGYQRVIYFDLDTVIVDNIDELAQKPCRFAMLHGIRKVERRASGIMVWEGDYSKLHEEMKKHQAEILADADGWDQVFISRMIRKYYWEMDVVQDLISGVVSYKKDIWTTGKLPEGARIVCFHGSPRPQNVATAHKWMESHWR